MTRSPGLTRGFAVGLTVSVLLALGPSLAEATTIIRTGTSGTHKAWVRFDQASAGAPLLVTLANISPSDVTLHADVLTAVFFNLNGTPTLTKVSATLADQVNSSGTQVSSDSFVFNCSGGCSVPTPNSTGGSVGGEWGYRVDSAGLGGGITQTQGISGTAFGSAFAASTRFDTTQNLDGPGTGDLAGFQYGLTSFGDSTGTLGSGSSGIQSNPLTLDAVLFTFSVPAGYALSSVTDVRFQYDETLGTNFIDVPLPPAALLLGSGILGAATVLQVRRSRKRGHLAP